MPVEKNVYYTVIPNCPNYLMSNNGKIFKKSTWKRISDKNGLAAITVNGKRKLLTISKLKRELFSDTPIPKVEVMD